MESPLDSTATRPRPEDWIRSDRRRVAVPSWGLSALFHGLFLVCLILMSQSKGCQPGYSGEGGESFHQVGVFLTSGETEDEPPPSEQPETAESPTDSVATPADFADSPLLDGPPVELNLPARDSRSVLGLGAPPSLAAGGSPSPSLETGSLTGPPPSIGTAMGGTTSVFGIADAGRRFVYVFDRSGSMGEHGAMRVAKAELMSSLERLDATQEFQVIFYNNDPLQLVPRNTRSQLFRGIDTQRLEVRRQSDAILPDGGTRHLEALRMALKLNPDVLFFLTDAAEPELTTAELADIKKRNNGGTRIHCIEFGKGPNLQAARGPKNFLQKLAEQNDGQYQYRDVTKFR
jgi:hypothetical protein